MSAFDNLYMKTPGFDEKAARRMFHEATNVRSIAVTCLDPRASRVPEVVAREFGETWPGTNVVNEKGHKATFTATLGVLMNAGGRAADALRSITTLYHILDYENVIIVHHTFCGLTVFTPGGVLDAYRQEHGTDLRVAGAPEILSIDDFRTSLRHDVDLVRNAPGTPKHINVYGCLFDSDTETLIRVIEDRGR